jgi:hypothetical protein
MVAVSALVPGYVNTTWVNRVVSATSALSPVHPQNQAPAASVISSGNAYAGAAAPVAVKYVGDEMMG